MSHSVRSHLRLEIDAYDDIIRKFIPGYEEGLTRAAKEIAGARPTLVLDLGAGTGALAEAMLEHERVGSVEAIDIDRHWCMNRRKRARQHRRRVPVHHGDQGGNVMAAGKSSRINRQYKTKYRIRNWREYERGLRSRGDVTIWLSEDAIAAWIPPKNGLRGGQRRYSNLAIRTALTLRVVFGLPLRQTEGFLDSLLRLMGLNLKAPDHTTLSRRNQIVAVPPLTRSYDGPIDLIVDSTGLKILGCGEWNAHKHKASKKRRDWRKLHIGVDAEGFIVAAELTASSRDDASTLPALLDTIEVPIRRFTADGAYDHRSVYDQLSAAGTENVVIVIPPRRSAVSAGPTDGPWAQRDTALERIRQIGRREWQKESGYRQQARVENSFFRYKSVFGGGLKARHSKAQRREAAIGCHILNRMAELGRPSSYALGR